LLIESQDTRVNNTNLTPVTTAFAIVCAIVCLMLPTFSAYADDTLGRINLQVTEAIKQHLLTKVPDSRVEVSLNPINQQLQLAPCDAPIHVTLPFHSGERITAKASCSTPRWSLFVTGRVRQYKPIVVAATPIVKGSRINAGLLELREQDIASLSGDYFYRQEDVVGHQARISISADTPITPRMLTQANAVNRGDPVVIEAVRGGVVIRTEGTARQNGRVGDTIDVLNTRSGREVRARIEGNGLVRVP
jgi:flagella basal body P-ring formation protein FlgA